MKPVVFGAVLALLWLAIGAHLTVPAVVVHAVAQAVTAAVVLVVLAHSHLTGRRRTR